jgi:hypothetical protein
VKKCNILCRYPDSVPAIRDLAATLVSTDQYGVVVASLRQQLQRRLLHAAVSTGKIITVYISILKVAPHSCRCPRPLTFGMLQVLLLLDPSATTVDSVAAPIKAYLRNRKDTLRCIIEGLISDTDSDLCVPALDLLHETSSLLTRIRYKELHAPHSGDPNRLSDTRDSSHVTVADDDVDNYRGESEAVFAAGQPGTEPPTTAAQVTRPDTNAQASWRRQANARVHCSLEVAASAAVCRTRRHHRVCRLAAAPAAAFPHCDFRNDR